jgi:Zn-dependent protease with chaperone function
MDIEYHEITPSQAPGLHRALEDLCRRAGIDKPILRRIDVSRESNPLHRLNYEHAALTLEHQGKAQIGLGDKFRKFFNHHHLSAPVCEELKAVIAHEIGHIKSRDINPLKMKLTHLTPYMGIVAGMAGTWYAQHLAIEAEKERAAGVSEEQVKKNMEDKWRDSGVYADDTPAAAKRQIEVSRIIAGGILGFAVGTGIYALTNRHIEFRADRIGAELMGSGEPLARALKVVQVKARGIKITPDVLLAAVKRNPITQILEGLTHPSDAERIERLNSWVRG